MSHLSVPADPQELHRLDHYGLALAPLSTASGEVQVPTQDFACRLIETALAIRGETSSAPQLLAEARGAVEARTWQRRYYELFVEILRESDDSDDVEAVRMVKEELGNLDKFFVDVAEAADRFVELRELTAIYSM